MNIISYKIIYTCEILWEKNINHFGLFLKMNLILWILIKKSRKNLIIINKFLIECVIVVLRYVIDEGSNRHIFSALGLTFLLATWQRSAKSAPLRPSPLLSSTLRYRRVSVRKVHRICNINTWLTRVVICCEFGKKYQRLNLFRNGTINNNTIFRKRTEI